MVGQACGGAGMRKSTARKMKADREVYLRETTEVWFPKAWDLALPDVPDHAKQSVREHLSKILPLMRYGYGDRKRLGVRFGECWKIAQNLTVADGSGRTRYVEGAYASLRECECGCNECSGERTAYAHGWNTVDGYTVDLIVEFFIWQTFGKDAEWFHEPLRDFSREEVDENGETSGIDSWDISSLLWFEDGGDASLPEQFKWDNRPGASTEPWGRSDNHNNPAYFIDGKYNHDVYLKSQEHADYLTRLMAWRAEWGEREDEWNRERDEYVNTIVFDAPFQRMKARLEARQLVAVYA